GQGGYYLTAQSGFRVKGAPSNNKGWKTRHIFISDSRGWGFRIEWSAHTMSNIPPCLSDEESELVERLRGILSSSRATRDMIEAWLVEAGLSPAPRSMSNAFCALFLHAPSVLLILLSHCKYGKPKGLERNFARTCRPTIFSYGSGGPCGSYGEAPQEKEPDETAWGKAVAKRVRRTKSVKELCQVPDGTRMKHYAMTLIDRVHDAGQIISVMDKKMASLRGKIRELKGSTGLEVVAVAEK
ncbi:hypothetical protein BHM03_00000447, partial [Ensete ventricosum]